MCRRARTSALIISADTDVLCIIINQFFINFIRNKEEIMFLQISCPKSRTRQPLIMALQLTVGKIYLQGLSGHQIK